MTIPCLDDIRIFRTVVSFLEMLPSGYHELEHPCNVVGYVHSMQIDHVKKFISNQ